MVRVSETQTEVAPNIIPLPLHVVLKLSEHSSALSGSAAVLLDFWNSEYSKVPNKVLLISKIFPTSTFLLGTVHLLNWSK